MKINQIEDFDLKSLRELYDAVGWKTYTKDIWKFQIMFKHSLCVLGAFHDNRLIGVIRTVGDHAHILYIQDILVHPDFQRQGVASALMDELMARFDVRQMVLITDQNDQASNAFYLKYGFKKSSDMLINCYLKIKP